MKWFWSWFPIATIALATVALTAGCSLQTRRYWLNVFFEGVPGEQTNGVAAAAMSGTVRGATNAQAAQLARRAELPLVLHPPYAQQKCSECHESKYSNQMRANLGDLCLNCHNQVLTQGRSWHAPAAAGDCVVCHEPHQSARKFLLIEASNLLCARCHELAEMAAVPAHGGREKTDCTHCHNPHQGQGKFLLRSKAQAAGASMLLQPAGEGAPGPTQVASKPGWPPAGATGGFSPAPLLTNNAASTPKP